MTCFVSKCKTVGLLLLGLVLVAGSFFCTRLPELAARLTGWAGVVFFGFCVVAIGARFAASSPQITVDSAGITYHRWRIGTIPGSDIENVWIGSVKSSRFLCLRLGEPRLYLHNLTATQQALVKANQSLGFGGVNLSFQQLAPGLDEVWTHILSLRADKAATPSA